MRPRLFATLGRFGGSLWRDERGEIVSAVLLAAKAIVFVLAATLPATVVVEHAEISACIDTVTKASASLAQRFPGAAVVPPDDVDVTRIQDCKDYARQLLGRVSNHAAVKNLTKLADEGLQNLGQCTLDMVSPTAPEAGLTGAIYVNAGIPFKGPSTNVTATVTLRGSQFSASLLQSGTPQAVGQVGIPLNQSEKAAGEVSTVVVRATSVVPPRNDGACVPPSTNQGGQCVVSCTTPVQNVVWTAAPVPDIKFFLASPTAIDANVPLPVVLAWNVANAAQVTIDQGIGEVALKGSWFELPPDQETTYTLTAIGARPQDTRTATQTVRVANSTPFTVAITSPAANSQLTTLTVPVTGKVTPAPGKILNGTITVNGGSAVPVTIDAAGNFAGSASLTKVAATPDIGLTSSDLSVTSCGDRSVPATVRLFRAAEDLTNTIAVTVTDGTRQASAAVTVSFAVQLTNFTVTWAPGCVPLNKNQPLNITLGPNQTVTVGTVDCGCKGSQNCRFSCGVRTTVGTSVGTIQDDSTWTFNVPGPCP